MEKFRAEQMPAFANDTSILPDAFRGIAI